MAKKRKGRPVRQSAGRDREYGTMVFIYIDEAAYRRLNGNEGMGKWYDPISCHSTPFRGAYEARVPARAVENDIFYPDRYEPDRAAESCTKVAESDLPKTKETPPVFKKGQAVWVAMHGVGVVSYEESTVLRVSKGKIWLDNGPGNDPSGPYDAKTATMRGDFGFSFKLHTEKPN